MIHYLVEDLVDFSEKEVEYKQIVNQKLGSIIYILEKNGL